MRTRQRDGLVVALVLAGVLAWVAQPSALTVRVLAVTHVQAVLEYTSPSATMCEIRVSETNDWEVYTPVNDVNGTPSVFDSQNPERDLSRDSTVCHASGVPQACGMGAETRTVVIGRVGMMVTDGGTNWWLGDDTNVYSRALQQNTTHYFRINCSGDIATGSFTTRPAPWGQTHREPLPLTGPGAYNMPTFQQDRTQVIIDPITGVASTRIALDVELPGSPFDAGATWAWTSGGFHNVCSTVPVDGGYHCSMPTSNGRSYILYWIHPTGPQVKYLGMIGVFQQGAAESPSGINYVGAPDRQAWSWTDGHVMYATWDNTSGHSALIKVTITGEEKTPDAAMGLTSLTNLTLHSENRDLHELVAAFSASYAARTYKPAWRLKSIQGRYVTLESKLGSQDSPSMFAVYDLQTDDIIAYHESWSHPAYRWCGNHTLADAGDVGILSWEGQNVRGEGSGGWWKTALDEDIASNETDWTVTGEPFCDTQPCYGDTGPTDTFLMNVAEGDLVQVGNELVEVTTKHSATSWTVTRAQKGTSAAAYSAAGTVYMSCKAKASLTTYGEHFWDFLDDPDASDVTGTDVVANLAMTGSHHVVRPPWRVMSGWAANDTLLTNLAGGATLTYGASLAFDGVEVIMGGNSWQQHPSLHSEDIPYGSSVAHAGEPFWIDVLPLIGGNTFNAGDAETPGLLLEGRTQIYRYVPATAYSTPTIRTMSQFGASYQTPIYVKSAPGYTLTDDSSDNATVCYAERANECVSGSAAGSVYVNLTNVDRLFCTGGEYTTSLLDACIGNMPMQGLTLLQASLDPVGRTTSSAQAQRVLISAVGPYKNVSAIENAKSLPGASYIIYPNSWAGRAGFLAHIPPATYTDTVDYSTHVLHTLTVPATTTDDYATLANLVVKVGYVTYGEHDDFYCSQRQEACYVGNSAGDWPSTVCVGSPCNAGYAADNSGTNGSGITGVSCTAGNACSIVVPVIPGQVAYAQIVYRNSGNATLGTSQTYVLPGFSQIARVP